MALRGLTLQEGRRLLAGTPVEVFGRVVAARALVEVPHVVEFDEDLKNALAVVADVLVRPAGNVMSRDFASKVSTEQPGESRALWAIDVHLLDPLLLKDIDDERLDDVPGLGRVGPSQLA